MFFNEDHLRITKVRTNDGISPVVENDKIQKKIIFAPLNPQTKKLFEEENKRKPNQLKMTIEVVKAYKPEPVISKTETDNSILEQQNKDLQEQNRILIEEMKKMASQIPDPLPISSDKQPVPPKSTVKNNQHETV